MFDIYRFFHDHHIPFVTEGHKQCRKGWIQIICPFCYGKWCMGYQESRESFVCYKCGFHKRIEVFSRLLRISEYETKKVLKTYYEFHPSLTHKHIKGIERPDITYQKLNSVTLPIGTQKIGKRHCEYLKNRNFDPEQIEKEWGIKGTNNVGPYKFRIIAPIYFNHQLVSYQGRDITGKSVMKYKACPKSLEKVHHKDILYGIDNAKSTRVVVVEGITDVWRLGYGAVATFGIKYKQSQVKLLSQFKTVALLYDSSKEDFQAYRQSSKLGAMLSSLGVDVIEVDLESGDPADLSQSDADNLMKELHIK